MILNLYLQVYNIYFNNFFLNRVQMRPNLHNQVVHKTKYA